MVYGGVGFTLKKLLKAHVDCFINDFWFSEVDAKIVDILSKVFEFIRESLIFWLSLAKFPINQIACILNSSIGESINLFIFSIPPFTTILFAWSLVPVAIFVKHHKASYWNSGYELSSNDKSSAVIPISISSWIGAFCKVNNFLIPTKP